MISRIKKTVTFILTILMTAGLIAGPLTGNAYAASKKTLSRKSEQTADSDQTAKDDSGSDQTTTDGSGTDQTDKDQTDTDQPEVDPYAGYPVKNLYIGKTKKLTMYNADYYRLNVYNKAAKNKKKKFTSSDESVVYVSEDGILTAKGAGTAKITVRIGKKSAKKKAYLKVTVKNLIESASILVDAYEYGAGVPKVIFKVNGKLKSFSTEGLSLQYSRNDDYPSGRTINSFYSSDERGNEVATGASVYVTAELNVTHNSQGSPFFYEGTTLNHYVDHYYIYLNGGSIRIKGKDHPISFTGDAIGNRITTTDTDFLKQSYVLQGTNNITGAVEDQTFTIGAYQPASLSGGEKNPLIIMLKGSNGGTDIDAFLYQNNMINLTREKIQSHFTSGSQTGAYVMYVEASNFWTDAGDGSKIPRSRVSRFTQGLKTLIDNYTASNTDVDTSRIYLMGYSQGAYMALNMLINYPDMFAASIPVSEIYPYYEYDSENNNTYRVFFTPEKAAAIKDIPIWFVHAKNDKIAIPDDYVLPVYTALLQAGSQNSWFSYYNKVRGADGTSVYSGHNVFICLMNDMVSGVQDKNAILTQTVDYKTSSAKELNGGPAQATVNGTVYTNVFDWLNAQHR